MLCRDGTITLEDSFAHECTRLEMTSTKITQYIRIGHSAIPEKISRTIQICVHLAPFGINVAEVHKLNFHFMVGGSFNTMSRFQYEPVLDNGYR